MLTLSKIVNAIDYERIQRSVLVRVTSLRYGWHKKTGYRMAICKTSTPEVRKGNRVMAEYVTTIEWVDDKKEYVKVHCNCPDFWARWEYVLHRKGAADIINSDGSPPEKTNPRQQLGCCKHLAAMVAVLQKKHKLDANSNLVRKNRG